MNPDDSVGLGVLMIGGMRYPRPLDPTSRKKFEQLSRLARIQVVGFSQDGKFHHFVEGGRFHLIPAWPFAPIRYIFFLGYALRLGLGLVSSDEVQAIICQSPYEGLAGAWIKGLAGRMGKKVVLITEAHGDWEESPFLYREVPLAKVYAALLNRIAGYVFRNSDMLRAISSFTRQKLEKSAQGKPIFVFPTYTDIELFLQPDGETEDAARESQPTVLFVGALAPVKGVQHLIEAMRKVREAVPQAILLIIGQGPYQGELSRRVEQFNLDGAVRFLAPLPQSELARYLKQGHLLVLPSLSEGLGRVLIEAMACGLPVVGTQVGGIPELIEEGVTGYLVSPGDPHALADRIVHLLTHPEEARRMGARGRDLVARAFSTERYVQGYAEIFQKAGELLRAS